MEHPPHAGSGPARLLFGVGAATCAWFAAFALESATRLMVGMLAKFGADLPAPTLLAINAVQRYVPWIMAAASTLTLVYLGMRASAYFLHACTVVAAVAAVLASFVALALVLPIMKCGIAWPEWPPPATQSSAMSGKAPTVDTPGGPAVTSCR